MVSMAASAERVKAEYLSSELLTRAGFRHAFFTRNGGVSQGAYASLNFSVTTGDDPEHVRENFRRAALALALPPERLYFVSQVHGRAVQRADGAEASAKFQGREGDIVVSHGAELACAVRTADCVPILLADPRGGNVAAVHAGWRGVAHGAVLAGLQALLAAGARAEELLAAIGPHISARAFEVSDDVAAELLQASPDPDVVDRTRSRPYVDLRRIVRQLLQTSGLRAESIEDVHGCTVSDAARFFSFRRDCGGSNNQNNKQTGRLLSAIVSRGA